MIKTAETYHVPVLLKESVDGLNIQPGGIYVDVTFGGGGHSREIISRLSEGAHLYSFDQDADAERNVVANPNFTFVCSNFRYLKNWMRYYEIDHIDGLLADSAGTGEACGQALLDELGLKTVQELETVPYAQLAEAYLKVQPALAKAGKNVGGTPYANEFYLGDPLKRGFRKESLHVPLLVGTVFAEFAGFFGPKDGDAPQGVAAVKGAFGDAADDLLALFEQAYPQRDPADLLSMDCLFRAPSSRLIRARAAAGGKVYSYLFDQDFEAFGRRVPWHCADIPFFFHNVDLVPVANIPGVSEQLQEQIFGMVMAFARTGNPAHAGIPAWPASTEQDEATMIFSAQTHLVHNHDQALMQAAAPALTALALQTMQNQEDQIQH